MFSNLNAENFKATLEKFQGLLFMFEEFQNILQDEEENPVSAYWVTFLDMTQVLLDYVKCIRVSNWKLHLAAYERMLPWFHAYDRQNYSRHFSYHWYRQKLIKDSLLSIYEAFIQGNISTKRTVGKFNMLPPDQLVEQTINKQQKRSGGIIVYSTWTGTVQRWVVSSHAVAEILENFKDALCRADVPIGSERSWCF